MNKRTFDALGRLFEADIMGVLLQSGAKIFSEIEQLDYCYMNNKTLSGWPTVEVSGWAITPLGHITYCQEYSNRYPDQ